eukprot:11117101-Prorocentrum_lima.AAC.1
MSVASWVGGSVESQMCFLLSQRAASMWCGSVVASVPSPSERSSGTNMPSRVGWLSNTPMSPLRWLVAAPGVAQQLCVGAKPAPGLVRLESGA